MGGGGLGKAKVFVSKYLACLNIKLALINLFQTYNYARDKNITLSGLRIENNIWKCDIKENICHLVFSRI